MKNQLNCGFYARRASHKQIKKTGVYNDGELVRCSMMPCQKEMFDDYSKRFVIDNAPPGSGKSTTIKFVHADYLTLHRNQKLIISIPQTLISKTFQKVELKYPDGSVVYWDIDQDLCDDTPNKVNKIVKFLNTTEFAEGINQRVMICTHSALAQAYQKLKNKSAAFVNTTLTIDEAHRLLYAEDNNASVANQLGHIVNHLVSSNPKGFRAWLATATFFRGDKLSILKEEVRNKFAVRHLPMDRHWEENVRYLESYTYDFVVYKHKPWKEIETLLSQNKKKTVIFCPAQNRPLADGCKYTFVANLKKHIHKVRPGARILDLVNESGREARKKILFSDKAAKDIDIVLAVNIFDEGADWVFGEQAIDLTPSNSLRVIVQRFGRIIRDVVGKKDVNYYTFLPFVLDQLDEEEYRKTLSKHFAAFTASLLLEEYIKPVEIPKPKNKEPNGSNGTHINYFVREVQDENKRGKIINKAQQNLISLKALIDSPTLKQTQKCIIDALKDSGVKKYRDAISKQIAFMWRRRLTIDGQDISWMLGVGFDKIWKDDIYDALLKFGSGVCGKKVFKDFRDVFSKRNSPEEWVVIAEQLAKEHGDILPNCNWLIINKYGSLDSCIRKYPEKFAHIEQESKKGKSPEEWVVVAEQLAKEHGGVLPCGKWLEINGHRGLDNCMRKYPEQFSHIEQDSKKGRTPEEWVAVAEQLTKEHGGFLPNTQKLVDTGYSGLVQSMKKYPEQFSHIKQDSKSRTPEEHVFKAEQLEKEHGNLPNPKWLIINKYGSLVKCINTHPVKFAHIKQDKQKGKTPDEWVKIAEGLAQLHGKIPNPAKLIEMGYASLCSTIYKFPEKFAHIPKSVTTKSPKEWLEIAKELAEDNNGVLPCYKKLKDKGHLGLARCLKKYPDLFGGFKQEKSFNFVDDWVPIAERTAKEHGGFIPNYQWLKDNGLSGLSQMITKYPEKFIHLEREKLHKTPQEWILVAEQLAADNDGILPGTQWLNKNGYSGLPPVMRKTPSLFQHIQQEHNAGKSPEEWISVAEQLVADNDGILPNHKWLTDNGYGGLAQHYSKNPSAFKGIKQTKINRTTSEWVQIANDIAKDGFLPNYQKLVSMGYGGLYQVIRIHPESFKHLKLKKKCKTPQEWVRIAEKLSQKHNGLPNQKWLQSNGYSGLAKFLGKFPKLYKHIKQDRKKGKSPEEWVPVAEQLAKEHGDILPNPKWLQTNKYYGLYNCMKKYPEKFAHIKQHRKRK